MKAELEKGKKDLYAKGNQLREYDELCLINKELQQKNIEMVGQVNNLQGKLDKIAAMEQQVKQVSEVQAKTVEERDSIKSENNKLRQLLRKKIAE